MEKRNIVQLRKPDNFRTRYRKKCQKFHKVMGFPRPLHKCDSIHSINGYTSALSCFLKLTFDSAQSSVIGVHAEIDQQFSILQSVIEDARKKAFDLLEVEHKQAVSQAESIHSHLNQKMLELKKTMGQMERFSKNKNPVDFLQVRLVTKSFKVIYVCLI